MKALFGTFAFVALTVIASVTLPSCCRKPVAEEVVNDKKFFLKFGKTENEFIDVKQPDFDNALCALQADKTERRPFKIRYKKDADASPTPDYVPSCPPKTINTDKITTSEVAQTKPAEESSAYDPNATYHVQSNNLADIQKVLDTFKTPTPTPAP
jgi:hypothetical protein